MFGNGWLCLGMDACVWKWMVVFGNDHNCVGLPSAPVFTAIISTAFWFPKTEAFLKI